MKAKRQGAYIAALLIFFCSVFPPRESFAFVQALPLLAFVAEGIDIGAGILIRQAGRQALVNLGVAANDASWVSSSVSMASGLARIIGLGSYVSGEEQKYQVQATPSVALPAAVPGTIPGALGSYLNPLSWDSPPLRVNVLNKSQLCIVNGQYSTDGLAHYLPKGLYAMADLISACEKNKAANLKPGVQNDAVVVRTIKYEAQPELDVLHLPLQEGYYYNFEFCASVTNWGCIGIAQFEVSAVEAKDGIYRIRITPDGTGFGPDDTDPDWDEKNKFPAAQRIAVKGTNSANEPAVVEVARVAGRTQVKASTQVGKDIKTRSINLTDAAAVDSVVDAVAPGSLASYEPSVASGAVTEPQSIVFPSDYARAGEALQAANAVKTSVDALKDRLADTSSLSDPEPPQYASHWGDTFTGLLSWSLPGHVSKCPVATFDAFDQTFRMDSHCQLAADYWEVLQVAMVVAWVALAFFIVMGA